MAWTEITRPKYQRDGLRYTSDTADAEWWGGSLAARVLGQRETGGTQHIRRKATAFGEWHEPYEARASRTVL
jgi:hypothetical protein